MLHIDEETRTHWYGATLKSLLPCLTTGMTLNANHFFML